MNFGQAMQLVYYDSTYIFVVGRAKDGSGNEIAFLHLKL
jgi:hypothetical protein